MPVVPPPCPWDFPDDPEPDDSGLVGVGADLEPGTILAAYRRSLFPMPVGSTRATAVGWWSPDPRGVLPLEGLRTSRSLRKACARFEIRTNTAFDAVIEACSDPARPFGWIDPAIRRAYTRLHQMGWAHSVEAWSLDDGRLAGGLYGLAIGGLFAGESMFHHRTDASKVALVGLVDALSAGGRRSDRLLDVQWPTEHLASLGAVAIPAAEYRRRLAMALDLPLPPAFAGG